MIPLLSVAPPRASRLEVDPFVPIRFRLLPEFRDDNVVGSLGDHNYNLSEIKVDRSTSELYAFTLIGLDREATVTATTTYRDLASQAGTPVVDLEQLDIHEGEDGGPAYFDKTTTLSWHFVFDIFVVIFDTSLTPTNIIDSGDGCFIASADALVGFMTKPLQSGAIANIAEWIAS